MNVVMNLLVPSMWGISSLVEELLASQEGLCSMGVSQLVSWFVGWTVGWSVGLFDGQSLFGLVWLGWLVISRIEPSFNPNQKIKFAPCGNIYQSKTTVRTSTSTGD